MADRVAGGGPRVGPRGRRGGQRGEAAARRGRAVAMRRRVEQRPNGEAAWAFEERVSMEGVNDGQTSAPTRTARLSRLAVASVPAAFLGCPIIVGEFRRWVDQYLPPQFHQTGEYGFVHLWFIVGCM